MIRIERLLFEEEINIEVLARTTVNNTRTSNSDIGSIF